MPIFELSSKRSGIFNSVCEMNHLLALPDALCWPVFKDEYIETIWTHCKQTICCQNILTKKEKNRLYDSSDFDIQSLAFVKSDTLYVFFLSIFLVFLIEFSFVSADKDFQMNMNRGDGPLLWSDQVHCGKQDEKVE